MERLGVLTGVVWVEMLEEGFPILCGKCFIGVINFMGIRLLVDLGECATEDLDALPGESKQALRGRGDSNARAMSHRGCEIDC